MRAPGQVGIAVAAVFTLLAASCEREPPRQRVSLTAERSPAPRSDTNGAPAVLRVGVASVLSPRDTLRHYRELIDYLGERLGVPAEMVQRRDYAEMNALLRERHCTAVFVCNYAYVRAHREFGALLLTAPQVYSQAVYRAYVIVGRDSPIQSLAQLAGKRLAEADPLCNAGWLFPRYRLQQLGHAPAGFFGSEIFTRSYENSIHAVAEGLADAAGVESPLYDLLVAQKQPAALKTRILETSPPFGTPPLIAHPQLDPQLRARLRDFFLTLHEHERGREILAKILVDRFVEPDVKQYEPVFQMAEAVEKP